MFWAQGLCALRETGIKAPVFIACHAAASMNGSSACLSARSVLLLQGTKSSKKKKQAKLKRVMATVKKQARKESANPHDSFAAVQLLNDPQVSYPCIPMRLPQ